MHYARRVPIEPLKAYWMTTKALIKEDWNITIGPQKNALNLIKLNTSNTICSEDSEIEDAVATYYAVRVNKNKVILWTKKW